MLIFIFYFNELSVKIPYIKVLFLALLLLSVSANAWAQPATNLPKESQTAYLDSIKKTFVTDNIAACVDSLWLKELTSLDLYNDLETDIKTINLDQAVEYELPTDLLKKKAAGNGFQVAV